LREPNPEILHALDPFTHPPCGRPTPH
jgi:hypothetical protein